VSEANEGSSELALTVGEERSEARTVERGGAFTLFAVLAAPAVEVAPRAVTQTTGFSDLSRHRQRRAHETSK
jgi:hypothetical protein